MRQSRRTQWTSLPSAHDFPIPSDGLLAQSCGEATLDAVAQAVDHLPLALELVVSYMQETRQTPAKWLEEWHKSPASTMSFHDADGVNYPVSSARVWERSVERLSLPARGGLLLFSQFHCKPPEAQVSGLIGQPAFSAG